MKTVDLNVKVFDESGIPVGVACIMLAGAFKRLDVREEHLILKGEVFVELLMKMKPFKLDPADWKLFRNMVIGSGAALGLKSTVLKALDK